MVLYIRQELTGALITRKFGGVDALVGEWEARSEENPSFPPARGRAAIYRWIDKGVPGGKGILALSALLDVDPLVIFDFHRNKFFDNFTGLRMRLQYGIPALGSLEPLFKLFRPGPLWPSDLLARNLYGRPWSSVEFENSEEWKADHYGLIRASFEGIEPNWPVATHIAYRRKGSRDTMWRFYGTVILVDGMLNLYTESGVWLPMPRVKQDEIRFRTYFGARSVEFRIASLHSFSMEKDYPFDDMTTIGFDW